MKKGQLFVFEGPDGAGKSTISDGVKRKIEEEKEVNHYSFPGKEPHTLGELVYKVHHGAEGYDLKRDIPPSSLQILHVAAHIDLISNKIIPDLNQGKVVLLDRYWWSTYVYGKVKGQVEPNVLDKLIEIELNYWKGYEPDKIFLINRDSTLKEDELDSSQFSVLKEEYRKLSQKSTLPVKKINNDGAPYKAMIEVFNQIKGSNGGTNYETQANNN